jgi:hypothetical protein
MLAHVREQSQGRAKVSTVVVSRTPVLCLYVSPLLFKVDSREEEMASR